MTTKNIRVQIPAIQSYSYPIHIQSGLLEQVATWDMPDCNSIVIITDNYVKKQYASSLAISLRKQGHNVLLISFSPGEKSKTIHVKCSLEEKMLRHHCGRDTLVLAIGGGVVGDMAGFVAATYMRGLPYVQIPTTLLAMVDSSVGGKTSIDTPQGKNLIGAFWQPKAVFADISCLRSLPHEHIINGLIEALKMFLTSDVSSFKYMQKNRKKILQGDEKILTDLVLRAVKIKADIVSRDEKENGLRMVLNFGHTIGHALEHRSDYKILHGYAVAYGILIESKISELLGVLESKYYMLIQSALASFGITPKFLKKFEINALIRSTKLDKKAKSGIVYYVLLENLGQVRSQENSFAHSVPDAIVKKHLER